MRLVQHGIERVDDYAWLKDPNWREVMRGGNALAPEIRAYLEAENAYAAAMMQPAAAFRAALLEELKSRVDPFDSGVPLPDGPYAYWSRFVPGAEHVHVVRAPRAGGPEQILLDGPEMAKGKRYFSINDYGHSPDHRLMAYTVDETGAEALFLRIRDLATGYDSPYIIPDASDFAWGPDSRALFYVKRDANNRARFVHRHTVGDDPSRDPLVYEEPDPAFEVSVYRTRTQRFVALACASLDTSEVRLIDGARLDSEPRLVAPRQSAVRYAVDDWGDDLVIRTNADGAADYKLVLAPAAAPGRENWRDLIPHRAGIQVEGFVPLARHLARLEREDGQQRIVIRRRQDGAEHTIAFEEEAYALGISAPFEFDTQTLRFSYSSPATPTRIFDYDLDTRARTLRKQQHIPGGHDPSAYVVRRLFAPASDGEMIPVTVLHRKDLALDGSAPAFLSGYGAYATTLNPDFNENARTLVDRGVVYATAHVRGGREKGERWRDGGRRRNKMNSFTDFIAVSEFLVREKLTAAGRIVAHGASAGGLLVGAVANMRPE
ncbi:MAG: S9 family peptidase, partial [Variibacter sp.]|nr:S9 family peptidase [Variibacter sp.]